MPPRCQHLREGQPGSPLLLFTAFYALGHRCLYRFSSFRGARFQFLLSCYCCCGGGNLYAVIAFFSAFFFDSDDEDLCGRRSCGVPSSSKFAPRKSTSATTLLVTTFGAPERCGTGRIPPVRNHATRRGVPSRPGATLF